MQGMFGDKPFGNLGDDLNFLIWPRLLPGLVGYRSNIEGCFWGIGSSISAPNSSVSVPKVVCGTGIGYGHPPHLDDTWKIYCVRGPRTAERLGLSPEYATTDAAALIRHFVEPVGRPKASQPAFMPHIITRIRAQVLGIDLAGLCADLDIIYVDPELGLARFIEKLHSARFLITEALHGAIVADSLRRPWIPVSLHAGISEEKWLDWGSSLNLKYHPRRFHNDWESEPSLLADFLREQSRLDAETQLSDSSVFEGRLEQLTDAVERVRQDFGVAPAISSGFSETTSGPPYGIERPCEKEQWLFRRTLTVARLIEDHVPRTSKFVLNDSAALGDITPLRKPISFLEIDGQYGGAPHSGAHAIEELGTMVKEGAEFFVLAWPSKWQVEEWRDFRLWIDSNSSVVRRCDDATIYRFTGSARSARQASSKMALDEHTEVDI